MNFEEDILMDDISIDPADLTEEWLRHPSLFFSYAMQVTEADREVKYAHERVKTKRSELIKECKEQNTKVTVTEVEAYYRTDPAYKEMKQDMIQKEYELSMLQNIVAAFYRKENSLKSLLRLLEMEYWQKPDSPIKIAGGKRLADKKAGEQVAAAREELNASRRRSRRNG